MSKAKFVTDFKGKDLTNKSPPPFNICIVVNVLYYLKPLSKLIIMSEPMDDIGSDIERASFMSLRHILFLLDSGKSDPINIYPFLDKFCHVTSTNLHEFEGLDVSFIWDSVIKLITVVMPPIREIFVGKIFPHDIPGWLNLVSRSFHAQFVYPTQTLEEVIQSTLNSYNNRNKEVESMDEVDVDDDEEDNELYEEHRSSPAERIRALNAKILYRAPEILVFAVESTHLPLSLRFTDMFTKASGKAKPPSAIRFPASFDMSALLNEYKIPTSEDIGADVTAMLINQNNESFDVSTNEGSLETSGVSQHDMKSMKAQFAPRWYDLTSVVTLEGPAYDCVQAYYRCLDQEDDEQDADLNTKQQPKSHIWYEGSGAHHEEVDSVKAIENNYFGATGCVSGDASTTTSGNRSSSPTTSSTSSSSTGRRVHPRLLIYTKRNICSVLNSLEERVTKAGQMRSMGDSTFEMAETPEHYDDAKHYYEEAIAYDESLRVVLQERMLALDQIERNQRAICYETQADISLGRRRFKEACDLYKNALRSAVVNSAIYLRIREKEDYMMKIISLEIANHLTEKGQDCLKAGLYAQGKEHFVQALKLNPSYLHLQTVIAGIDAAITIQASAAKVTEANTAMKNGKYKLANSLFLEAIALVPERERSLRGVLDSLVNLMQGEEALVKQRCGLVALEDKKYAVAINYITEAIGLLPSESVMEHAFFLCDRAQVHFEVKDYVTAIQDCHAALELRPDLAMAYLRLGSAQFELQRYDEATVSYERAIRNDTSLSDQVKIKVRQVNTAKEVLQRKIRESERLRAKEEEKRLLEERRARDEAAKKARQAKLAQEQAEKAERLLMSQEEKIMRAVLLHWASKIMQQQQSVNNLGSNSSNSKDLCSGAEGGSSVRKDNNSCDTTSDSGTARSVSGTSAVRSDKEKARLEKAEKEQQRAIEKDRLRAEKEKERERVKIEKERKLREEKRIKQEELLKQQEFAAEMDRALMRQKEAEREKELEREKARLEREKLIAEREKAREEKLLAESKKAVAAASAANNSTPIKTNYGVATLKSTDPFPSITAASTLAAPATPLSTQAGGATTSRATPVKYTILTNANHHHNNHHHSSSVSGGGGAMGSNSSTNHNSADTPAGATSTSTAERAKWSAILTPTTTQQTSAGTEGNTVANSSSSSKLLQQQLVNAFTSTSSSRVRAGSITNNNSNGISSNMNNASVINMHGSSSSGGVLTSNNGQQSSSRVVATVPDIVNDFPPLGETVGQSSSYSHQHHYNQQQQSQHHYFNQQPQSQQLFGGNSNHDNNTAAAGSKYKGNVNNNGNSNSSSTSSTGSYQSDVLQAGFQYGAAGATASAWADHERAMLEATAERISIIQHPSISLSATAATATSTASSSTNSASNNSSNSSSNGEAKTSNSFTSSATKAVDELRSTTDSALPTFSFDIPNSSSITNSTNVSAATVDPALTTHGDYFAVAMATQSSSTAITTGMNVATSTTTTKAGNSVNAADALTDMVSPLLAKLGLATTTSGNISSSNSGSSNTLDSGDSDIDFLLLTSTLVDSTTLSLNPSADAAAEALGHQSSTASAVDIAATNSQVNGSRLSLNYGIDQLQHPIDTAAATVAVANPVVDEVTKVVTMAASSSPISLSLNDYYSSSSTSSSSSSFLLDSSTINLNEAVNSNSNPANVSRGTSFSLAFLQHQQQQQQQPSNNISSVTVDGTAATLCIPASSLFDTALDTSDNEYLDLLLSGAKNGKNNSSTLISGMNNSSNNDTLKGFAVAERNTSIASSDVVDINSNGGEVAVNDCPTVSVSSSSTSAAAVSGKSSGSTGGHSFSLQDNIGGYNSNNSNSGYAPLVGALSRQSTESLSSLLNYNNNNNSSSGASFMNNHQLHSLQQQQQQQQQQQSDLFSDFALGSNTSSNYFGGFSSLAPTSSTISADMQSHRLSANPSPSNSLFSTTASESVFLGGGGLNSSGHSALRQQLSASNSPFLSPLLTPLSASSGLGLGGLNRFDPLLLQPGFAGINDNTTSLFGLSGSSNNISNSLSGFNLSSLGGGGGGSNNNNSSSNSSESSNKGIDNDVVSDHEFPTVAWLRSYQMHMYRWAGNAQEWTEFAMHIPRDMTAAIVVISVATGAMDASAAAAGRETVVSLSSALLEVARNSGCRMWIENEILQGMRERFLVFNKGSDGQPSHHAMLIALELLSNYMKQWIIKQQQFQLRANSSGIIGGLNKPNTVDTTFLGVLQQHLTSPPPPTVVNYASTTATNPMVAAAASAGASTATISAAASAYDTYAGASIGTTTTSTTTTTPAASVAVTIVKRDRPPLLKVQPLPGSGYVQRYLEIPREVVGLIIGQGGKKIKELCAGSGAKIQFKVNKTAEREGRPGLLEVHGSAENVDRGMTLIWDLVQLLGKEYNEVPFNPNMIKQSNK